MKNKVFWIGGSSCSGKSTIAKLLSDKYELKLYNTDNNAFGKFMFELEKEEKYPAIIKYRKLLFEGMDCFAKRDIDESLEAFTDFCKQVFELMIKDIEEISKDGKVIVEGAHVFPYLIKPYTKIDECYFLISGKEHQKKIWLKEMSQEIPGGHPGEIENFNNSKNKNDIIKTRIEFHDRIGRKILSSANELNFKSIRVSNNTSINFVQNEIEKSFGLSE